MNQEYAARGLLRSSAVVGSMTLLSRVLGLARDVVLAAVVGASENADAFFVAFRIPNFLRRLFAEGAFSQAFVPVLADVREGGGLPAVRELVDRVAGILASVLLLLTSVAVLAAPAVTAMFAPGFLDDPEKFALTVHLIRITFPYLLLISLTGLCAAILNSYGRFAVPAFTPVLLNLCLISAATIASPWFREPVHALAWGVFCAGILQLVFQLPSLHRIDLVPRPRWDRQHEGVRRILRLMVPALFGVSVSQLNLLFDTVLASFLPGGSVSWLYYSDRLTELPLGVFGIAIATVLLPSLSAQRAASDSEGFSASLDWSLRCVLLVAVPATGALTVLAEPILATLFQYGEMGERDVVMAAHSLRAYALGLTAFMLIKILAPGFYAREDTRTPVRIGIIAMLANMVFNVVLVVPLHFYFGIGHVGLALATSLSAFLNAGLLWRGLHRTGVFRLRPGWWQSPGRMVLATGAMTALLAALGPAFPIEADMSPIARAVNLAVLVGAGGASYVLVLFVAGARPADFVAPALRKGNRVKS